MTTTSPLTGEWAVTYGLALSPGKSTTALGGSARFLGLAQPCFVPFLPANSPTEPATPWAKATAPEPSPGSAPTPPETLDEGRLWLRIAAPAFAFWDNPYDDAWNAL